MTAGQGKDDCEERRGSGHDTRPYPHTKEDGSTETRAECVHCGMVYGSGCNC